mmetsp:Transcript_6498/g.13388  ORF Transcript_6498/g.13388 Transcript_6498/m.13388 type:complete len:419 (+) Transcript_6498:236-1492(+)|eukprot:scaffold655_cov162-Amphora_coffeaeformis.AAC.3
MLQSMQRNHTTDTWKQDVEKLLASNNTNNNQASSPQQAPLAAARRLQQDNNTAASSNAMGLSDQQLLLALQQQQRNHQMDPQTFFRLQQQANNSMDREALLGQGFGAAGFGGDAMNDRMLLQLLNERRQQASLEQEFLQRQALAREFDYERNLLQRLNPMGGFGAGGFGGLGADPLGRSQGGTPLDPAARFSFLNGGAPLSGGPSPMLQGVPGLPPTLGGALGGPGMVRGGGPVGGPPFDDSITLEARSKQAFPLKLYRMLERAERNGQDDIISFIDDGKAFAIHKPRAFETDIMPSYFNSHRMSSFQRQLNIYGFERINDGIQKGAYRHKFFVKGKNDLLDKIKRPQKLRHGGGGSPPPHEDEDEDAAKLQTIAAERLVGLSRTASGAAADGNKSEGNKSDDNKSETESKSDNEKEE